jgi:hypothetical protein
MKISQPALGWSHPEWLVARWQKRWGDRKNRATAGMEQHAAENLRARQHAEIPKLPESELGDHGTRPSEFKDAGNLLARWREENVEYDFVRRDWTRAKTWSLN